MTHNGLAQMKQAVRNVDLTKLSHSSGRNMSHTEQDASLVAGAALLGLGLLKFRRPTGWALLAAGGGLLYRGLTGQCQLYKALGVNTDTKH
jgi:uncharacterized membrane protein